MFYYRLLNADVICGLQENRRRKFKYRDIIGEPGENHSADPARWTHDISVKSYDTKNHGVVDKLIFWTHLSLWPHGTVSG
jgi:hypothetical protein